MPASSREERPVDPNEAQRAAAALLLEARSTLLAAGERELAAVLALPLGLLANRSLTQRDRRVFGDLIATERQRRGLSQEALAERAGLSVRTVRNVEHGLHQAELRTIGALSVALGLDPADVLAEPGDRDEGTAEHDPPRPNSFMPRAYDPRALVAELQACVRGAGGTLEQSLLYVDPASAQDWLAIRQRLAAAFWDSAPIPEVARAAASLLGSAPLIEVDALGCGDAQLEVLLTRQLHAESGARMRLQLLDISHPLLNEALQAAGRQLGELPIEVLALHADFHRLPRYPELARRDRSTPRIWTLLGFTLSNLQSEDRFFADLAALSRPGDLLVVDLQLGFGSPDRPEQLKTDDPGLREDADVRDYERWLAGPFWRHLPRCGSILIERELSTSQIVPGSYAVNWRARIELGTAEVRTWVVAHSRRYDLDQLATWLLGRGWGREMELRYGPGERSAVLLLRRV